MITIRNMGGIGNQIFQLAFGIAQAHRLNTGLQIELGSCERINSYRPFNLGLFDIQTPTIESTNVEPVRENGFAYDPNIDSRIKDGDTLFGFWQSEKYFAHVADKVRARLCSVNPWPEYAKDYGRLIQSCGDASVMVGIRRDDYVNVPRHANFHGAMPYEYYKEAIGIIARQTREEPVLFVFTDEPEWVKANWDLGFKTYYFIGDRTVPGHIGREDVDLGLMGLCKHAVIANGTFHWWGAWLGDQGRTTKVIAPKQWFLEPQMQAQTDDIIPDRWLRI